MSQLAESNWTCDARVGGPGRPLPELIDEAVSDRATPISRLLRLMFALDAEETANENLRLRLRARIGAPLSA